jgi:hypothetical protein
MLARKPWKSHPVNRDLNRIYSPFRYACFFTYNFRPENGSSNCRNRTGHRIIRLVVRVVQNQIINAAIGIIMAMTIFQTIQMGANTRMENPIMMPMTSTSNFTFSAAFNGFLYLANDISTRI